MRKNNHGLASTFVTLVLLAISLSFAACSGGDDPAPVSVTSVTLNKNALTLPPGESETLVPAVQPLDASNKSVTWASDAPTVATVSGVGLVAALAAGEAIVTVTTEDGGKTDTCRVTALDGPAPSADVYVAGQEYLSSNDSRATLWANGAAQRLSDDVNSRAYSVFVSGDDTYVFGAEQSSGSVRFILWKNGVRQELGFDDSTFVGYFVSGNDVYVAGQGGEDYDYVPTIWKNGVAQPLSDEIGWVESVFVAGNDVYAVGIEFDYSEYPPITARTILWKNGEPRQFDSFTFSGNNLFGPRYSIFVSGNDTYVAGHIAPEASAVRAVLWKNGERRQLSDDISAARSVFASGGDVYVAGSESTSGGDRAVLWKNGVRQQLSDNPSSAYSVRVLGGDVYVGGSDSISGQSDGNRAVVWMNGERRQLSDNWSTASSVFVK
jgi:hypothetical protein